MSLLLRAVTDSCMEKRKVIFYEQTVSRNLKHLYLYLQQYKVQRNEKDIIL